MPPSTSVAPPDPPLTDGRVRLRPIRDDDLPRLMEDGSDTTTARWVNVAVPYTEEAARKELAEMKACWDDPSLPLALVIADAASDRYCGVILLLRNRPASIMEVGYGVHPAARRQGFGAAAVRLIVPWAFSALGVERLEARTDPENIASQRALARAGFTREGLERRSRSVQGERRDMICWSLLPADLEQQGSSADYEGSPNQ